MASLNFKIIIQLHKTPLTFNADLAIHGTFYDLELFFRIVRRITLSYVLSVQRFQDNGMMNQRDYSSATQMAWALIHFNRKVSKSQSKKEVPNPSIVFYPD